MKGNDLKDKKLFKFLTTPTTSRRGFRYEIGKNTDKTPFNPNGDCQAGGLFFTDLDHLSRYVHYGDWIATVELEDNEEVYQEPCGTKYKAHSIIITSIVPLKKSALLLDLSVCLALVRRCGDMLQFMHQQTPEICTAAVLKNAFALQFVKHQTHELCLLAVKQHGWVLRYVNQQTPDLCLAAVNHYGNALKCVVEQTPEICLAAVKQNGLALEFVKQQTPEICLAAVNQNGMALQYVLNQTVEVCLAAVKRFDMAKMFVRLNLSSEDE